MLFGAGGARAATYTQVAAGSGHACGLVSNGTVQCWGYNASGQLGNNSTTDSPTPVTVLNSTGAAPLAGVSAIAAGMGTTCALLGNGTVQCWGNNSNGQLGNGDPALANRSLPVAVTGLPAGVAVIEISLGGRLICARLSDGTAWCWGINSYGQLGDGSTTDRNTAVQVAGLSGVSAISAGNDFTCAIASGGVQCWGQNLYGQLGNGNNTDSLTPVAVNLSGLPAGASVTAITTGIAQACILLSDSTVWCWGLGTRGELGNGATTSRNTPVQVLDSTGLAPLTGVSAISAGTYGACAALGNGNALCWGTNRSGELGNNTASGSPTAPNPLPVYVLDSASATPLTNVTGISRSQGGYSACALLGDGGIVCWGNNDLGQLGDGTTTQSPLPVKSTPGVTTPATLPAVTPGTAYSPLVTLDGTNGPITWSVDPANPLPPGLTVNPATGAISGTVSATTAPGTYSVTIVATNSTGSTPVTVSIKVNAPPVPISSGGATAVPTLGEWGLILLALLLGMTAVATRAGPRQG